MKARKLFVVYGALSGKNLGGQPDTSCRTPGVYWAKRGRTGWWRAVLAKYGATAIRVVEGSR